MILVIDDPVSAGYIPTRVAWLIEVLMKGPLILRAGKGSRLFDQLRLRPDACVKHKLFDRLERDHLGTANRLLPNFRRPE